MDVEKGIIPEIQDPAPLTLNISDREYVVIGGKDTTDQIVLELRENSSSLTKSFRDKRENLIINSKSICNKKFLDWKLDEAFDEATCTIQIKAVRLNSSEREIVLNALSSSVNEDDFAKKISNVKGVFLLDNDLLLSVIDKYGDGIYRIIEKLNYRYHLCYLSESIHNELHRRKESLSKFQSLIDKPMMRIQIGAIFFSIFITALCITIVLLKK